MAPVQPRGFATVDALLDAALALSARGEKLTARALAEATGTSVGGVYHHFDSLDAVRAALFSRCLGRLLDELVEAVTATDTARDGIEALTRGYLGWTRAHPDDARYVHFAAAEGFPPPLPEQIAAMKRPRMEALARWVAPRVASGELVALPEPLFEMVLIGPLAETARRWLAGVVLDLDEAMALLPERLWAAVRGKA
jgi:AcrR family transcriptional regulator